MAQRASITLSVDYHAPDAEASCEAITDVSMWPGFWLLVTCARQPACVRRQCVWIVPLSTRCSRSSGDRSKGEPHDIYLLSGLQFSKTMVLVILLSELTRFSVITFLSDLAPLLLSRREDCSR